MVTGHWSGRCPCSGCSTLGWLCALIPGPVQSLVQAWPCSSPPAAAAMLEHCPNCGCWLFPAQQAALLSGTWERAGSNRTHFPAVTLTTEHLLCQIQCCSGFNATSSVYPTILLQFTFFYFDGERKQVQRLIIYLWFWKPDHHLHLFANLNLSEWFPYSLSPRPPWIAMGMETPLVGMTGSCLNTEAAPTGGGSPWRSSSLLFSLFI